MRLVKILDEDNITVYLNPTKINYVALTKEYNDKDEMFIVTDSRSLIRTRDFESMERLGKLFQ